MNTSSISVALCTYNGAQFLGEQLASIADQTRLPDELVVCDDCSSDATCEIVCRFAESAAFPVRLHRNPVRLGVSGNFAKAIALCQCDLIAISDQDDVWPPEKLNKSCGALDRQPQAAYAFSDAELMTAEGRPLGRTLWQTNSHRKLLAAGFPAAAQVSALLKQNVATGATMVFRKSLLPRVLPIPATWMHDYWIACVASCRGAYGIAIPEPLLAYRQHAGQVVGGPRTLRRRIRDCFQSKASEVAAQLAAWEDLAIRLRSLSDGSIAADTFGLLDKKILHLGRRLAARQTGALMRATVVLAELSSGRYKRFSNSWQSAVYDLVSGVEDPAWTRPNKRLYSWWGGRPGDRRRNDPTAGKELVAVRRPVLPGDRRPVLCDQPRRRFGLAEPHKCEAMTAVVRPEKANTCAVVVTYQPDDGLTGRIARISSLVRKLVIVDNHSTGESIGNIGRIQTGDSVQVIRNDRNLGIAAALNQGLAVARAEDYRWVITFDQDTLVGENLLRELQAVYDCFPEKERIAVIGCNYWDPARGRPLVKVKRSPSRPWIESKGVITSGSLISLSIFDEIGPFLSALFIDRVDVEYCLRARSKGFRILLALEPAMQHSLGPGRTHATAWGKVATPGYPPARWYYIARNSLILARKYLFKEPRWIAAGMVYTAIMFAKVLWLEDGRTAKVRHAAAGLADGLRSGTRIRGENRCGRWDSIVEDKCDSP